MAKPSTLGGVSSDKAKDTDAESSWTVMRVVRSPDSAGVALGFAAELLHSTALVIVCACWSSMTVVLEGAGLELAGAAGPPPFVEQADRPATNTTTPSPAAPRTIRRPTCGFLPRSLRRSP